MICRCSSCRSLNGPRLIAPRSSMTETFPPLPKLGDGLLNVMPISLVLCPMCQFEEDADVNDRLNLTKADVSHRQMYQC